jgi:hypothetical protein
MSEIKIKDELSPQRCEVCHQNDCFDPDTNYCSRCKSTGLIKSEDGAPNSVGKITIQLKLEASDYFQANNPSILRGNTRQIMFWVFIIGAALFLYTIFHGPSDIPELQPSYSQLMASVEHGDIKEVTVDETSVSGKGTFNGEQRLFRTEIPNQVVQRDFIYLLHEKNIDVNFQTSSGNQWLGIALTYAPILLFIAFWIYMMRKMQNSVSFLNRDFEDNMRCTFSREGYELSNDRIFYQTKWEALSKVVEIEKYFLIFPNLQKKLVIPKRLFNNQSEILALREFIETKIGNKATLIYK